jgi:hypothetical protein
MIIVQSLVIRIEMHIEGEIVLGPGLEITERKLSKTAKRVYHRRKKKKKK